MSDLKTRISNTFGTPALVVDLAVVAKNIHHLQDLCDAKGIKNRPHIKTHKSVTLAHLQMQAGAVGITCQKLSEAEIMAEAGINDILITYNIMGEEKIKRLAMLTKRAKITLGLDNEMAIKAANEAALMAEQPISILIECDTGRKRTGVETVEEVVRLAHLVKESAFLRFDGLMIYPPEKAIDETNRFVNLAKLALKKIGLAVNTLSSGGTPNLLTLGEIEGQTEHRSGTSIFNDRMMMAAGFATKDTCALQVYTTVVSRAGEARGILDAGSKVFTSDTGWNLEGYGLILEHEQAVLKGFAEEHGFLDFTKSNTRPMIGDILRVIPNHVCPVVNVVGELVLVRGDEIIGKESVEARGKLI